MSVDSIVIDYYIDKLTPQVQPYTDLPLLPTQNYVTKEEFNSLKKEILDMKELLKKAKIYDTEHNEPNCEKPEKIALLKQIAKILDINLDDVLTS